MTVKILAVAGSLRKLSFNKKLVKIAADSAMAAGAEVVFLDLTNYEIPIYNGDLETEYGLPQDVKRIQQLLMEQDGLLLASPEYNGSISGMLKNMIDWTSRPNGDYPSCACYKGKIAAVMSISPGALGGVKSLIHTRTILSNIGCIVLPGQVAVPNAFNAFDNDGKLADKSLQQRVEQIAVTVYQTINKLKS